jgi:hypothetical protein
LNGATAPSIVLAMRMPVLAVADGYQQSLRCISNRNVAMFEGIELGRQGADEQMHRKENEIIQLFGHGNAANDGSFGGEVLRSGKELLYSSVASITE